MDALQSFDNAVRAWVIAHRAPVLDVLMLWLTIVGRGGGVWLAIAAVVAWVRRDRAAGMWRVALAVVIALLATDYSLKPLIGRTRPYNQEGAAAMSSSVMGRPPTTASFPSGHAATSFAAALVLSREFARARRAVWALAVAIALSRLYVAVHFPTDIAAGALLGFACGAFVEGGSAWYIGRPAAGDVPQGPR